MKNCKHQAFGKVTFKQRPIDNKELSELIKDKQKLIQESKPRSEIENVFADIDSKIVENIKKAHKDKLEKDFQRIRSTINKKGSPAAIFELRRNILGGKIQDQEPSAIECQKSGKIVTDPESIKEHSLAYCTMLLKNREPSKRYKDLIEMKKELHSQRMILNDGDQEVKFTRDNFVEAITKIRKKKSEKYRFIVNSGNDLREALFNLFKIIWETEKKPDQWRMDKLIQIHKKGSKLNLENYRFIHIKEEVPKLFGFIVTTKIKDNLIKNMSRFQIGAVPGHMPQEHLFCLRSLISQYEKFKKPLIISFYDIKKFFDKEFLIDALDACYKAGVTGNLYRLLHMMNSETKI